MSQSIATGRGLRVAELAALCAELAVMADAVRELPGPATGYLAPTGTRPGEVTDVKGLFELSCCCDDPGCPPDLCGCGC
ncbi:hypothetical protein OG936_32825 [Streptomyces sp. NBC_00846]|uniref:hypothetical protein n=1 Tax=Streptomyces sp. NBC_00846 TaxID=2975849 RepID=UPI0038688886|nr:hypothetical protein OG936_32825 [Streptomyces sp. NBC_00846]